MSKIFIGHAFILMLLNDFITINLRFSILFLVKTQKHKVSFYFSSFNWNFSSKKIYFCWIFSCLTYLFHHQSMRRVPVLEFDENEGIFLKEIHQKRKLFGNDWIHYHSKSFLWTNISHILENCLLF